MAAAEPSARHEFRPDVEGLRGVAVLLVVLFHAGISGVGGGFIGVDVFFVISGFLITGLLLRERERTGRIGFRAFYARRVRRLLPAAAIVLAVVLPVAWLAVEPLDRTSVATDAMSAALSVGNIRFAMAQGDYFASVANPSAFLHFWSLAVEEQFYLLWPLLLVLATRGARPRVGAGVVLTLVLAGSFVANLALTATAPSWAFYSLPTRAWQLAAGGLLAVGAGRLERIPSLLLVPLGWVGLAAVVGAALGLDSGVAYPGANALIPTLGAAALLAGGPRRFGAAALVATPPLRGLGRISYSLYLWHWPILVLPAIATGTELPLVARLGLVGLSIVVATASCLLVEEPFRRGLPVLQRRPGATLALGGAVLALLVALGAGLSNAATEQLRPSALAAAATERPSSPAPDPPGALLGGRIAASPGAGRPAPWQDPGSGTDEAIDRPSASVSSAMPTLSPSPAAVPVPSPTGWALPADVQPPLLAARDDAERLIADGCLAWEQIATPRDCVYGNPAGSFTIALIGDSHASDWFPAVEAVAKARGWRVVTYVKVACPFADMPVYDQKLKREYTECASFRAATIDALRAHPANLVLVSMNHWLEAMRPEDSTAAAQGAAMARAIEQLPGRVALMVDRPRSGQDVPACLSAHLDDVRQCAVPLAQAFTSQPGVRERAAAGASGAGLIDLSKDVCTGSPCPVVVRDMIVFRDNHHLTATFARSLAPQLAAALDRVLAGA
ncbi:MAG TPA: acyltransferase family protein [Candidatus Dormibacteraeota bacterium]|nr:acyltransferase family protein [Candidatus Dormibacteraeota bacterium]